MTYQAFYEHDRLALGLRMLAEVQRDDVDRFEALLAGPYGRHGAHALACLARDLWEIHCGLLGVDPAESLSLMLAGVSVDGATMTAPVPVVSDELVAALRALATDEGGNR